MTSDILTLITGIRRVLKQFSRLGVHPLPGAHIFFAAGRTIVGRTRPVCAHFHPFMHCHNII